jgi:hypothetical protein
MAASIIVINAPPPISANQIILSVKLLNPILFLYC